VSRDPSIHTNPNRQNKGATPNMRRWLVLKICGAEQCGVRRLRASLDPRDRHRDPLEGPLQTLGFSEQGDQCRDRDHVDRVLDERSDDGIEPEYVGAVRHSCQRGTGGSPGLRS